MAWWMVWCILVSLGIGLFICILPVLGEICVALLAMVAVLCIALRNAICSIPRQLVLALVCVGILLLITFLAYLTH